MMQYAPRRNYSAPAPVAAVVSAPVTTADVSPASFAGVSEADQITAIRKLYAVVNPDKMSQVGVWARLSCAVDGFVVLSL